MISSDRYVRWNARPGLFNVTASSSPSANEMKTTAVAKTIVHAKTLRNGLRISELWMMRPKLRVPTAAFQPGSSSWPLAVTNEPRLLSL